MTTPQRTVEIPRDVAQAWMDNDPNDMRIVVRAGCKSSANLDRTARVVDGERRSTSAPSGVRPGCDRAPTPCRPNRRGDVSFRNEHLPDSMLHLAVNPPWILDPFSRESSRLGAKCLRSPGAGGHGRPAFAVASHAPRGRHLD